MNLKWTTCIISTAAILAIGLVISIALMANAYTEVNSQDNISVTGQAKDKITADNATWTITVNASASDKETAYDSLTSDTEKVLSYLKETTNAKENSEKLSDDEITVSQIASYIEYEKDGYYNRTNVILSHELSQTITVKTTKVYLVDQLSRKITDDLGPAVNITSNPAAFYCMDLAAKKVEMVELATTDSVGRAKGITKSTGRRLGKMKSAKTGVFQIVPVGSTEIDDYGINDSSTIEKEIICTVKTVFSIK